jgi:hypothetical protein
MKEEILSLSFCSLSFPIRDGDQQQQIIYFAANESVNETWNVLTTCDLFSLSLSLSLSLSFRPVRLII